MPPKPKPNTQANDARVWARLPTTAFAGWVTPPESGALAVLPVYDQADHGLGLPLNAGEILGDALLAAAVNQIEMADGGGRGICVMPPLRFGPAPYPSTFFGVEPDAALQLVNELARGVQRAGFAKLLIFSTGPWHREWLNAAALDIRVATGLRVFRLHLSALDLDFHPAAPDMQRAAARTLTTELLGRAPAPVTRPAELRDVDFRPGCFLQPGPVAEVKSGYDGVSLDHAAARLAGLLAEAAGVSLVPKKNSSAGQETLVACPFAPLTLAAVRGRYLPASTRDELEAISEEDKKRGVVILPTAAIEQHGPHLPVGVDAYIGRGLLGAALERLPADAPVWVAPPLSYGKSTEHENYPGTLSLTTPTFRALLHAQAKQLHQLGFRTLAILNTHGGNSAVLTYTLRELQTAFEPPLRAGMLTHGFKPGLDEVSAQERAFGFHAGDWETSLMLAIEPGVVRMERALCAWPARLNDPGELRPEGASLTFAWATEDVSPSGVMGDATRATEEKGKRWLAAAADGLAAAILRLMS